MIPFVTDDEAGRRLRKIATEMRLPAVAPRWRLEWWAAQLDDLAGLLDPQREDERP